MSFQQLEEMRVIVTDAFCEFKITTREYLQCVRRITDIKIFIETLDRFKNTHLFEPVRQAYLQVFEDFKAEVLNSIQYGNDMSNWYEDMDDEDEDDEDDEDEDWNDQDWVNEEATRRQHLILVSPINSVIN